MKMELNPIIDFSKKKFLNNEYIFEKGSKEYNILNKMNEEKWEKFLIEMASNGVFVEFDDINKRFIIRNNI